MPPIGLWDKETVFRRRIFQSCTFPKLHRLSPASQILGDNCGQHPAARYVSAVTDVEVKCPGSGFQSVDELIDFLPLFHFILAMTVKGTRRKSSSIIKYALVLLK